MITEHRLILRLLDWPPEYGDLARPTVAYAHLRLTLRWRIFLRTIAREAVRGGTIVVRVFGRLA